jgi:hypothetical protein
LWQFASEAFGSVALVKMTNGPELLGNYCSIKDDEDDQLHVEVITGSWIESLTKAVLLFHYGLFGDFTGPNFERLIEEAPVRYPN